MNCVRVGEKQSRHRWHEFVMLFLWNNKSRVIAGRIAGSGGGVDPPLLEIGSGSYRTLH